MKRRFSLFIKLGSLLAIAGILLGGYLAYNIGERIERHFYGVKPGVTLEGEDVSRLLRREVEKKVEARAAGERVLPQNARIDKETGDIVPEIVGQEVDVLNTVNRVMGAQELARVSLVTRQLYPEITGELLAGINKNRGSFFTWLGGGNGGRVTNIRLAAGAINHTVLAPGELFSFNRVVGPRTARKGYQFAPIIVSGTVVPGLGGGICQVSSTLYNAVLEAGLEVVERYPHSRPVGYVAPGRDATVSDFLDFKFRNDSDRFVLVKGSTWGGRIQVEVWSN